MKKIQLALLTSLFAFSFNAMTMGSLDNMAGSIIDDRITDREWEENPAFQEVRKDFIRRKDSFLQLIVTPGDDIGPVLVSIEESPFHSKYMSINSCFLALQAGNPKIAMCLSRRGFAWSLDGESQQKVDAEIKKINSEVFKELQTDRSVQHQRLIDKKNKEVNAQISLIGKSALAGGAAVAGIFGPVRLLKNKKQ